ncbi:hypothetical protein RWE15_24955 [Virgibacillus halophilus]|uniref:Translation initiation factor 3 N-terminal domain-containing protein n=1 Tax=Tigheibacillus halophilus TaxID=361280 RepID=A0ABU5CC79_9BACI|nr:hypothetical protein [Virgibacillus halophilus]
MQFVPTLYLCDLSICLSIKDQRFIKIWRCLAISKDMNVNEKIRAREVRLIDSNGDQLGVKSRQDALEIAQKRNLDLVMVAPTAKPPCLPSHGLRKIPL